MRSTKYDELLEAWDNRLTIDNLALAKRYVEGELKIGLMFSLCIGTEAVRKNYIAVIERELDLGRLQMERHGVYPSNRRIVGEMSREEFAGVENQSEPGMAGANRYQDCMLIKNVELVKTPKGICASFIRLQPLHQSSGGIGRSFEIFRKELIENLFGGAYWEVGTLQFAHRRGSIGDGERGSERVQCGAQVMNNVANDRAPAVGDRFDKLKAIEFVSGLRRPCR